MNWTADYARDVPFDKVYRYVCRRPDRCAAGSGKDARARITRAFQLVNLRGEPVVVELCEDLQNGQARIVAEDRPHVEERGSAMWRIALEPGERLDLQATVEQP